MRRLDQADLYWDAIITHGSKTKSRCNILDCFVCLMFLCPPQPRIQPVITQNPLPVASLAVDSNKLVIMKHHGHTTYSPDSIFLRVPPPAVAFRPADLLSFCLQLRGMNLLFPPFRFLLSFVPTEWTHIMTTFIFISHTICIPTPRSVFSLP